MIQSVYGYCMHMHDCCYAGPMWRLHAILAAHVLMPSTLVLAMGPSSILHGAGQNLTCRLEVTNTGNVRLAGIYVPQQCSCPTIPQLAPSATASCNVSWVVEQSDFDTWDAQFTNMASGMLERSVTVTASVRDTGGGQMQVSAVVQVPLVSRPQLSISYSAVLNTTLLCYSDNYYIPGSMGPTYGPPTSPCNPSYMQRLPYPSIPGGLCLFVEPNPTCTTIDRFQVLHTTPRVPR